MILFLFIFKISKIFLWLFPASPAGGVDALPVVFATMMAYVILNQSDLLLFAGSFISEKFLDPDMVRRLKPVSWMISYSALMPVFRMLWGVSLLAGDPIIPELCTFLVQDVDLRDIQEKFGLEGVLKYLKLYTRYYLWVARKRPDLIADLNRVLYNTSSSTLVGLPKISASFPESI